MSILYDSSRNILTIRKLDIDRPDCAKHVLDDVRGAYKKFVNTGVYEVLDNIFKNKLLNSYSYNVREDASGLWNKVYIRRDGMFEDTFLCTLPNMDSLGRLQFRESNRQFKALVNVLVPIEDLSYSEKDKMLNLAFTRNAIKIDCSLTSHTLNVVGAKKHKIALNRLIELLSHQEGEPINVAEKMRNPLFVKVNGDTNFSNINELYRAVSDSSDVLVSNIYNNPEYTLKYTRDSINQVTKLDRAIGYTLSRKIVVDGETYPEGTLVTASLIEKVKRARINELYVEYLPVDGTHKLIGWGANCNPLLYIYIPKGTYIPSWMEEEYGIEVDEQSKAVKAVQYSYPVDLTGKYATEENLKFLKAMGVKSVFIGTDNKSYEYHFELEIIGNYTAKYRELVDDWSKYTDDGDKMVCWKDNPDLIYEIGRDRLHSYDLLALYSLLGFMELIGTNPFMDKDADFLKRVNLADTVLARTLYGAFTEHYNKYRKLWEGWISGTPSPDIFKGIDGMWWKRITQGENLLNTIDTTNYVAELSQVVHVEYKAKKASEGMRHVATPYYGRVCSYETPEGEKVGLVNSKAIGCKIVDGIMYVPYKRVLNNHDGTFSIGNEITYLSVKDEVNYRIGDVLQFKCVGDNLYENTRVIAKVPNPSLEGCRVIFAEVYVSDLDYVFAHPEAYMSPVASMIPAASSDDAIRVSFGSKMIKSSIYLVHPDKPRVMTSMYEEILQNSELYFCRAEKDGIVTAIGNDTLSVLYDGEEEERTFDIREVTVTTDAVVFMRYRVLEDERFCKGQVLYDTAFSQEGLYRPGKSILIAYMPTGYNYEDAVHVSERATIDFMSLGSRTCKFKGFKPSDKLDFSNKNTFLKKGSTIGEVTSSDGKVIRKLTTGSSNCGIWYKFLDNKGEYQCSLMNFNRLHKGDKLSGLHGNKGVNAMITPTDDMPMLSNGMPIKLIANPHGIPSRMNLGQLMEGHLGLCAMVLDTYILSDPFNGANTETIEDLMKWVHDLANAKDQLEYIMIANSKPEMPESFVKHVIDSFDKVQEWKGTFDEYGDAMVYNPVEQKYFPNKVTIAVPTFMKLKQEVDTKIHERAGLQEEDYIESTRQPTKGGALMGGQAMGEMEMSAILAYGASDVAFEMCNEKCDNIVRKTNLELKNAGIDDYSAYGADCPRSVENMLYYLEVLGLAVTGDEVPDVKYDISNNATTIDMRKAINSVNKKYEKKEQADAQKEREDVLKMFQ